MYLTVTPIYDLREDEWLGKQNGIDFLMSKPANDGYITLKNGARENYKASRTMAAHVKSLPVMAVPLCAPYAEDLKQYSCAVAFDRASMKRNAEFYSKLQDGDAFVVLHMKDWLQSGAKALTDKPGAEVVYKHVLKHNAKRPKPYAFMHRKHPDSRNGYTEYVMPKGDLLLLSEGKFQALQAAVDKAIALSELSRTEYFTGAGAVLWSMLRVMSVLPECGVVPFDYASKQWVLTWKKTRIVFTVNMIDLVDLSVETEKGSQSFEDLNVYLEQVILAEGMLCRTTSTINEPLQAVYEALTHGQSAGKQTKMAS